MRGEPNRFMGIALRIFVLLIMLTAIIAMGTIVQLMLDAPKEENNMSEPKEFLYRCAVCKGEKVESVYAEKLFCRSDDGAIMQYLGDQPAGEAANKRAEKLDPAEILEALINLEGMARKAGNDTTKYQALIKRIAKENPDA